MSEFILILAQAQAPGQPLWLVLMLAVVGSGALTGGLNYWFNRQKTDADIEKADAETADVIQRAAGELIQKVRDQAEASELMYLQQNKELLNKIAELRVEVQKIPELETKITDLTLGVALLTEQLRKHDIPPAYPPMVENLSDR